MEIKKAGWCGGGGNCVVIKHNSTYETVMHICQNLLKELKEVLELNKGQTIGYVGFNRKIYWTSFAL